MTLVEYLESLSALQGDLDCDGDADASDSLVLLRGIAALDIPPCGSHGDVDCGQQVDAVDSLKIPPLRGRSARGPGSGLPWDRRYSSGNVGGGLQGVKET